MQSPLAFGNIFANLLPPGLEEQSDTIVPSTAVRIERIVSHGHCSPEGFWYDQDEDEWVLLLAGSALLDMDGRSTPMVLKPGDWVLIPAHRRHRVVWTDPNVDTVWLAVWWRAQKT